MNAPALTPEERKRRPLERMEKYLLTRDPSSAHGMFEWLHHEANQENWSFDWKSAMVHWSELVRLGAIATIGNNPTGGIRQGQPFYLVTPRGRAILERGEELPHNEDRYLSALRRRVPAPDAVALSYVAEAVGAWKVTLYRASAVMLGCACERLILLLAEHLSAADISPFSEKLGKQLRSGKPANISDVFTQVHEALRAAAADRRLPGELPAEVIDRRFSPIFEHARRLRNASGHPTGEVVQAEDAEAGLLFFPSFHEFVSRVIVDLKPKTT